MPNHRTSSAAMADKKKSLLAIIEGAARNGHVCPSLSRLAELLRLGTNTVHEMLHSLRNERVISWTLVFGFGAAGGRVRVVTIKATGARTAMPGKSAKQRGRPARSAGPVFIGPPVRTLTGAEFRKRADELERRDRAERARAESVLA